MTTMTPITEILRNCKYSGDFGSIDNAASPEAWWLNIIERKAADSGFGHLVESYLERGWVEGSTIGWTGESIMNGHHRLVMAILLGLDEVPTVPYWGEQNDDLNISTHSNFDDPYPILLSDTAESYNETFMNDWDDDEPNYSCCSMCG